MKLSKKLIVTIICALLVIADKVFALGLPSEAMHELTNVVIAYLGVQGLIDSIKAIKLGPTVGQ